MTTKQEITYTEKLTELEPLYVDIFTSVKKDLRDEHLKVDRGFFKRNFHNRELSSLSVNDLINVYSKFIKAETEPMAEFIANRWLLRHLPIYNFFEARLKTVTDKIEEITLLEEEFANALLKEAISQFGVKDCYIFSVLNQVAFPKPTLTRLKQDAIQAAAST